MILKPRIGKSRIYDLVHKGAVNLCILGSFIGFTTLGVTAYRIFKEHMAYVKKKQLEKDLNVGVEGEVVVQNL